MVEYIGGRVIRKAAAFSGKVVEYIGVELFGKLLLFRKGAAFQERWSSI